MPRPQKTCHSAAFRVTVSRSLAQVVLELLPSCPPGGPRNPSV